MTGLIGITNIRADEQLTVYRDEKGLRFKIECDGKHSDFLIPKLTPDKQVDVIFQYKINEFRDSLE